MPRIIRDPECERKSGLSNERRRTLEIQGLFPRRFKIVPGSGQNGAAGWFEHEVDQWVDEHAAERESAA